MNADESDASGDARSRILQAAATLVSERGVDALTTRAVAAAAGTQGPTIYRLFGDKQGLIDALAEQAMADYVGAKRARSRQDDPLTELRIAWDEYIAFALAHPAIYRLARRPDRRGISSPSTRAGIEMLRERVHQAAIAGMLRVAEERAVLLIHAAGAGTMTALLEQPAGRRDEGLATVAREMVMAAIADGAPAGAGNDLPQLAGALRARITPNTPLTPGERLLLDELLARLGNV